MIITTMFLYIITLSLMNITVVSASEGGTVPRAGQETGKSTAPRKPDPHGTTRETPPSVQQKQIPMQPDRKQAVEERLRAGQMEKPIAQGEISDRLNQLYSGSNSGVSGEPPTEHSDR